MEVMHAVRFPKIFSPRVLIRDSNRVNEFDIQPHGFEPTGLTLSLHCWESPVKSFSAFTRRTKFDAGLRDPSTLERDPSLNSPVPTCRISPCGPDQEPRYLATLRPRSDDHLHNVQDVNQTYSVPSWHWNPDVPQDLSAPRSQGRLTSGVWEVRGSSSSPGSEDLSKTPEEPPRPYGGRFKGKTKVFKCPYCVITCSNRGQLLGHIRIHTGERPFVCQEPGCKKAFIRNEELTRHRRIHTGERPYVCDTCKKAFTRKDHLNKHVKIHSNTDEIFSV